MNKFFNILTVLVLFFVFLFVGYYVFNRYFNSEENQKEFSPAEKIIINETEIVF